MAAIQRNNIERARDRRLIAPMYLIEKISQGEIADRLNERPDVAYTITQQTVSNDLAALEREWLAAGVMDLDEAKAKELARIDALECEYWQAWQDSIASAVKVSKERKVGGEVVTVKQEVTKASGDARFLAGVQWCIDRRCKLLGLDATVKSETTIKVPDDPRNEVARLLDRLATSGTEDGANCRDER